MTTAMPGAKDSFIAQTPDDGTHLIHTDDVNELQEAIMATEGIVEGPVWVNVRDKGALGDNSNDDTSAIQDAIDTLGSTGGTVYFPPGIYKITSELTIDEDGIQLLGASNWLAIIRQTSTSANGIKVSADYCTIRNLRIQYGGGSAAVAGAGVQLYDSASSRVLDCIFSEGWYINFETVDAYNWHLARSILTDAVSLEAHLQSVAVPDAGDSWITGCQFSTSGSTVTCIKWESGGGLHFVDNKVLGHENGLLVNPPTGVLTQNIFVHNNSFENMTAYAFRAVLASGSPTVNFIKISNNEIDMAAGVVAAIQINSGFNYAQVNNNTIQCPATSGIGIDLEGGWGHQVTGNTINFAATGIKLGDVTITRVSDTRFNACTVNVEDNTGYDSEYGPVEHYYENHAAQNTSTVTYQNVFDIQLKQYKNVLIETFWDMLGSDEGTTGRVIRKIARLPASPGAVTVTAVEDTASGTAFTVDFDVSTNDHVVIRFRKASGSNALYGRVTLVIKGAPLKVTAS